MQLPPQLETKFNELAGRYPVKRSALIPMMLYAQDHLGSLGDEILQEIAKRLDLNIVQVEETLAYYSMLHRKPMGRNHIQVCTNISCMLRGGNELYKHVQRRLGIGHKEVSASGTFSLEEVECMGACTGAPAMQVNYDFYEDLDADKVDAIFEQLQEGKKPKPSAVTAGSVHERLPAEVPVISKRFGIQRLAQDRRLPPTRRLSGARKGAEDDAGRDHRRSQKIEPARARRRGISVGHEVELRPQGHHQAEIHPRQRRRERARHLQGPPADGNGPAPADRRHGDRGPGRRRAPRLHLYPRRVSLHHRHHGCGHRRSLREGLSRQEYPRQRIRFRPDHAHRRRRLRMRRGIGADGIARRQARLPAHPPALPCRRRPLRLPHGHQQRRNTQHRSGDHPEGRRMVCRSRHAEKRRHAPLLDFRPRQSPRNLRAASRFSAAPPDRRSRRRRPRRQETEGCDSRRQLLPAALRPTKSTSPWTTIRSPKSARCSARAARS